jgi:hypothetical protein
MEFNSLLVGIESSLLATLIRQDAALLAHQNTIAKKDAHLAAQTRGSIANLLEKR